METLIAAFLEQHVQYLTIRRQTEVVIKLYFGPLRAYALPQLTPLVIEAWFRKIGQHSKAQANKSLDLLRFMFKKAQHWRLFDGVNPALHIKHYPMKERTRFVKPTEMPRLMQAIARKKEVIQCYFLLCLFVGNRKMEGLSMKWADVDLEAGVWNKSRTKTGISHTVPIPASLLVRIAALPRSQ